MILVTGVSGFVGSHVFKAHNLAKNATGLDRQLSELHELADLASLDHFWPSRIEAVIHCAAVPEVGWWPDRAGNDEIWRSNVDGTRNLLEALPPNVRRFVFVSSSCVYGHDHQEGRAVAPISLYGASKVAGEALVTAYAEKKGFTYAIVRPVALYGSGYRRGHVKDFIERYRKDGKVQAWDSGSQRKWGAHVEDLAEELVALALEQNRASSVEDFASEPWTWRDTARVMGIEVEPGPVAAGFVGDAIRTRDYRPAVLGWRKLRPVEQGVREALASLGWTGP